MEENYLLGVVAADGGLRGRRTTWQSRDVGWARRAAEVCGYEFREIVREDEGGSVYGLVVFPKVFTEWAVSRGLIERKSLVASSRLIPEPGKEIQFLRGLLDGDGCVSSGKYIGWFGTPAQIEWVSSVLWEHRIVNTLGWRVSKLTKTPLREVSVKTARSRSSVAGLLLGASALELGRKTAELKRCLGEEVYASTELVDLMKRYPGDYEELFVQDLDRFLAVYPCSKKSFVDLVRSEIPDLNERRLLKKGSKCRKSWTWRK